MYHFQPARCLIYWTIKQKAEFGRQSAKDAIRCLENNLIPDLKDCMFNKFEEVVKDYPEIENLKLKLLENNAIASLMTGSGSCVFGVYEDREALRHAYNQLKQKHEAYVAISYNV